MSRTTAGRRRSRGSIDELPSGALRVRVFAGIDPVTRRRHYLTETVPAGPHAARLAEQARTRFLNQVDEQRNPRTQVTVDQLLDKHFDMFEGSPSTLRTYRGYADNHIRPLLGRLKAGTVDAAVLDSFYAELRRCRDHCDGRPQTDHRTPRTHECDQRCRRHECVALGNATIRQVHFILSGAFSRAVRWRWLAVNPAEHARPPATPRANPKPPTAAEAAQILTEAWQDPDWGTFIWLAMITGARRGELCALRWNDVHLTHAIAGPHDCATAGCSAVLHLHRSIGQDGGETWETDTKTHQQRRVALDAQTAAILAEHRTRHEGQAALLDVELSADGFVFSPVPDASTHQLPDSVTQRYGDLARRLGIDTTLHKLRHFSATELIAAGVDVRTVAGRLGHAGGGTMTLRAYAAWLSEVDQRAASNLGDRLPARPATVDPDERAKTSPRSPYERIAAEIYQRILSGVLTHSGPAPSQKEIAAEFEVSAGTAHRAVELLKAWGVIEHHDGDRRATVTRPPTSAAAPTGEAAAGEQPREREPLDIELMHLGEVVRGFRTEADPDSTVELRQLLTNAVKRYGGRDAELGEYEMNVRYAGERGVITTFAANADG